MIPTNTARQIPIRNGRRVVAVIITPPSQFIHADIYGPKKTAITLPERMVTIGVTMRSIFVSFETSFPNSVPTIAEINAPTAPPNILPAYPTIEAENKTKVCALSECATAIPMAAPVISRHIGQMVSVKKVICSCCPTVLRIVPTSKDEKSPIAIALIASIKYRLPEISISFFFKKSCNLFISSQISLYSCGESNPLHYFLQEGTSKKTIEI